MPTSFVSEGSVDAAWLLIYVQLVSKDSLAKAGRFVEKLFWLVPKGIVAEARVPKGGVVKASVAKASVTKAGVPKGGGAKLDIAKFRWSLAQRSQKSVGRAAHGPLMLVVGCPTLDLSFG